MTSFSPLKPDLAPSASSWNPWPTGLVVVLGLFATGVFSFGLFAVRHSQDLVSPDYYDREIRHQEHMDRVTRTDAASSAASVAAIVDELVVSRTSERQGRLIDSDENASMERKKREGYF